MSTISITGLNGNGPVSVDVVESITESRVVERERTHLNEQEHSLIKELLRPGASIEAVIPDGADPEQLWGTLDACVRGLGLLEARICRLKPIIGRILLAFENKPSLYKSLGYETYTDFMNKGVYDKLGLHKTSAYEGKLAAREWPQLTPDKYAEIGPKKLNVLAKFTTGSNSNAQQWIDTAKSMKLGELKEYVAKRGLLAPGEADGATFVVNTNRNLYSIFESFFKDGRVQSLVGSKERDKILESLIQECFDPWIGQYEDDRKKKLEAKYK